MASVNFTANLIKHTEILKRNDKGVFKPAEVSIVELDKEDPEDIKSLGETCVLWDYQGADYASEIYRDAEKDYEYDGVLSEHYFALTEQNDYHKKLIPEKILGLMVFSNTDNVNDEINWLQVRPDTNKMDSCYRGFKNVGKSMIDMIKNINYGKDIHVTSSSKAIEFYKKQGFENDDPAHKSSLRLKVCG